MYDSINENYVGVFDDIHIKQWTKSDASIEKLKKQTMKHEIHDILVHKKTSFSKPSLFLLFKNGACMELEAALKHKGDINGILKPEEEFIHTGKIISQEEKFLIIVAQSQNVCGSCFLSFSVDGCLNYFAYEFLILSEIHLLFCAVRRGQLFNYS